MTAAALPSAPTRHLAVRVSQTVPLADVDMLLWSELIVLPCRRSGELRVPKFELAPDAPRRALMVVWHELVPPRSPGWSTMTWLTVPHTGLGNLSAVEFLRRQGDVGMVVSLAHAIHAPAD